MAISRKEIEHIASLARLDSTGGIFDRLADDMQGIVAMVDKLAADVCHCTGSVCSSEGSADPFKKSRRHHGDPSGGDHREKY